MTKEENIATLNEHLEHWKRLLSEKICDQSEGEKTIDALQNAIKALEQQPCDDAISRQAVIDGLISIAKTKAKSDAQKSLMGRVMFFVEKLPSVTPQQKVGRWIEHINNGMHYIECPKCSSWFLRMYLTRNSYCPNCGAKMGGDAE